jgi:biotin-(acetyl-CoA carboxylase) ligase
MDNVILSLEQVCERYGLTEPAVRRWLHEGIIQPVRRAGRGRGGKAWFSRYEVESLIYAVCPICGERFKRATLRQRFCGKSCRQKAARMRGGSHA